MALRFKDMQRSQQMLYVMTGATMVGMLFMIISISTDYWVILTIPSGSWRNTTQAYMVGHHSGLWRICREEVDNSSVPWIKREYCTLLKLFPSNEDVNKDPEIDDSILNYSRTETAFAVISLCLMILGLVFSIYALNEPRYMFKRLAALLHFIVAVCILVCAEVLSNSVSYEQDNLPARHPTGAYFTFGFSYVLAWIVFVIFLIAGVAFLVLSGKRKGDRAYTEQEAMENEPVHLGRH